MNGKKLKRSVVAVVGYLCAVLTGLPQQSQSVQQCLGGKGGDGVPRDKLVVAKSATLVSKPTVISRTGWGCPDGQSSPSWSPQYTTVAILIVHHSVNANTSADWPAVVRSIWNDHTYTRGWGDVGYNFLIDPNGNIYEGRAGGDDVIGAHFSCQNSSTMGVCLLGTFTTVSPTASALNSLKQLLAWKASQRGIDPLGSTYHAGSHLTLANISGHRDGNSASPTYTCTSTECPGDNLYGQLATIRSDVNALINAPTVVIPSISTLPATSVTANSAVLHGRIDNDGGASILERRFEWATGNWGTGVAGVDYGVIGNGSISVSGNQFSATLDGLQSGRTYKFRVWARNSAGWADEALVNVESFTTSTPTVATPTISPDGGSFINSVQVTLACASSEAFLYYTTDGTTPTTSSTSYEGPFTLTASATVKAKAFKSGYTASGIASANFTVSPATRVIALSGDLNFGSITVGTTAGRTLTIANNGNSVLTVNSISYPAGFSGNWSGSIAPGGSQDVSVIFSPGNSTVYSGNVTVNSDKTTGSNTRSASGTGVPQPTVATPTISPNGGNFSAPVQVTLACPTPDASIHYTIDGSSPTESSPTYEGPFSLNASATVKAKGFKAAYSASSVASVTFTISIADSQGPTTVVNSPTDGANLGSAFVLVTGNSTDASTGGHGVASVLVNGVTANNGTAAGSDAANWSARIGFTNPGPNTITIIVKDSLNNATTTQLTVVVPEDAFDVLQIAQQPTSGTFAKGQAIALAVTATSQNPISYQWTFNGRTIAGANSAEFVIQHLSTRNAGAYAVVVSDGVDTLVSDAATVRVVNGVRVVSGPANRLARQGRNVVFTVNSSGTQPITYQWFFNGAPIDGATGRRLVLYGVQPENAGEYWVVVSNPAGSIQSRTATLTIH